MEIGKRCATRRDECCSRQSVGEKFAPYDIRPRSSGERFERVVRKIKHFSGPVEPPADVILGTSRRRVGRTLFMHVKWPTTSNSHVARRVAVTYGRRRRTSVSGYGKKK
uniref:Uncharacterized protein n=1 Tax=Sipha flava TaxID=143950 RepID=A0A2S2QYK5_9HEMI